MPEEKLLADLGARVERLEAVLLGRIPQPIDPSPDDWGRWGGYYGWRTVPVPVHVGDPPPPDISRLSRAQLQVSLESIKAQRIRLDTMETMINQQLKEMR